MSGLSARRFETSIRKPAAEALTALAKDSAEILHTWQREGRVLRLDGDVLGNASGKSSGNGAVDFQNLARQLRKCSYATLGKQVQDFGGKLARNGVALDRALTAINRLFEISMLHLADAKLKGPASILALSRLQALVALFVVSGYAAKATDGQEASGNRTLSESDDHRHGASAYVTKVYEEERQRLSRDLHDEVGHDLILIKLYLEMIAMDTDKKEFLGIKPRLAEAISLVSHAIDSVRRLVLDLGPAVFDDLGFMPAVRTYTSQFSARTKIPLTLREGYVPDDIPMSHQVAMYRLLQGALSNVLKHAFAKNVKVSLGAMKDAVLVMVIEDDGIGFDTTARPGRRSFGLTAMRERVEVLGGRIHIQSRPHSPLNKGRGTRIEVDLPLPGGVK